MTFENVRQPSQTANSPQTRTRRMRDGVRDGEEKPPESKAARFKRLINRRVPKAIVALQAVENLANTRQYEYTPEQRDKVLSLLGAAIKTLADAYSGARVAAKIDEI